MTILGSIQKFFRNLKPFQRHHFFNEIPLEYAAQELNKYLKDCPTEEISEKTKDINARCLKLRRAKTSLAASFVEHHDDSDDSDNVECFTLSFFFSAGYYQTEKDLKNAIESVSNKVQTVHRAGKAFEPTDILNCHDIYQKQFKFHDTSDAYFVSSKKLTTRLWVKILKHLDAVDDLTRFEITDVDCFCIDLGSISESMQGGELLYYKKAKNRGTFVSRKMVKQIAQAAERELDIRIRCPDYFKTLC